MEKPLSAYKGDGPYVFVCYAHEDSDSVYSEIAWLNDYGVNVWYDEGISPGHEWTDELASAIQGCTRVLYFVTPNSVASEHCRRELNFAQDENREVVSIHLVPTEVPPGLRLSLNNRQAILKHELSEEEFHKRLMRVTHGGRGAAARTQTRRAENPQSAIRLALAAAIVLFLGVAGVWWIKARDKALDITEVDPVVRMDEKPSIAVLPFANLSSDPEQEFFADGMADEVLTHLARMPELKVISRTSSFSFKGQNVDLVTIAERLDVGYLIEGSVRKVGERVRINVQLVDVAADQQVWSETYERSLSDVFEIQSQIAMRVATQLNITLLDYAPLVEEVDPAAYAALLQANYLLSLDGPDEDVLRAEQLLNEALRIEPDYVRAMLELARASERKEFRGMVAKGDGLNHTRELVRRAMALSSEDALANGYLGWLLMFHDHDLAAGAPYQERALQLDPLNLNILRPTVPILMRLRRFDDATRLAEYVVERDPLCVVCLSNLAAAYIWQSRLDDAEPIVRRGIALSQELLVLMAYLRLKQNRSDEVLELTERMPDVWYKVYFRTLAHYGLGDHQAFDAEFTTLRQRWPERRFALAIVYAYTGNTDLAFEAMAEAVDQDPDWKDAFYYQSTAADLRELLQQDPRWESFLRRYGIAQEQLDRVPFDPPLPI